MSRTGKSLVADILAPDGGVRCAKCRLRATTYMSNGNLAIEAFCPDGESWDVLTVNPGFPLNDDCVCVKDYSEGAGNLKTLEAAGLIEMPPIRHEPSGFVLLPVCRLTEKGRAFVARAIRKRGKT